MSTPAHKCRHCANPCRENFVFCYTCKNQLPEQLQEQLTRNFRSEHPTFGSSNRLSEAIIDASAYLKMPMLMRNDFIRGHWRLGKVWAKQFLLATGQITYEEDMKMSHDGMNAEELKL